MGEPPYSRLAARIGGSPRIQGELGRGVYRKSSVGSRAGILGGKFAKVTGSRGSYMRVQGANRGETMQAQGGNWGAHLNRFSLCLILGFLKLGELKR